MTILRDQPNRELQFLRQWRLLAGGPEPVRQFRFHPQRRWRFDFAWPDRKVAVEIQGGTWKRGKSGHTSGRGVQRDYEKGNAAAVLGWRVLHFTSSDLDKRPAEVVAQVAALLRGEPSECAN